jgi:hypothetical protein
VMRTSDAIAALTVDIKYLRANTLQDLVCNNNGTSSWPEVAVMFERDGSQEPNHIWINNQLWITAKILQR